MKRTKLQQQKLDVRPCKSLAAAAAKSLQLCPILYDPIDGSPPGSSVPWDFPGKSTGVGCHCLLLKRQVSGEARQEIQSKERLMSKMLGSVETRGIKDVYGPPVECLVEHRTRRLWD